ncbi:MAG: hypothetical protein M0O95_05010 [Clostridiales bacterium]|nr:hypothetical protein [Clostridiales bacterium]
MTPLETILIDGHFRWRFSRPNRVRDSARNDPHRRTPTLTQLSVQADRVTPLETILIDGH